MVGTAGATTKTIDIDVTMNDYIGAVWTFP